MAKQAEIGEDANNWHYCQVIATPIVQACTIGKGVYIDANLYIQIPKEIWSSVQ